jgi:hypothetical protein
MSLSTAAVTVYAARRTHEALLRVVDELTDEQLTRGVGPSAPPIAFHLWHAARWADLLQSRIPAMTMELGKRLREGRQIWEAEALAQQWGLDPSALGESANGMGMDDDVSAALSLPAKEQLADYARRVFEATNQAIAVVDDEQLQASCIDLYGRETSVGAAVISHLTHLNRHLGMIEALRGVHGLRGTATV